MVATTNAAALTAERLSTAPFPARALRFDADKELNGENEPIRREEKSDIGDLPQGLRMNP
jgi:hypothetical protein